MNDLSSEMGLLTNFELVDQPEYWEVPLEGAGPPDNPVPNAEGLTYGAGLESGIPATTAAPATAPAAAAEADESLFSMAPTDNGHADLANGGMVRCLFQALPTFFPSCPPFQLGFVLSSFTPQHLS